MKYLKMDPSVGIQDDEELVEFILNNYSDIPLKPKSGKILAGLAPGEEISNTSQPITPPAPAEKPDPFAKFPKDPSKFWSLKYRVFDDKLYEAKLSYEKLLKIAVKLGADVPFLIRGGTARAKGIGEILEPIKPIGGCYFLIAKGESKPSTGEMFRLLDSADYNKPDIEKTATAIKSQDMVSLLASMDNSFAALWRESRIKAELLKTDADAVSLSGSGPAWFAVYLDKNRAVAAEKALKALNIPAFLCEPENKSLIFE